MLRVTRAERANGEIRRRLFVILGRDKVASPESISLSRCQFLLGAWLWTPDLPLPRQSGMTRSPQLSDLAAETGYSILPPLCLHSALNFLRSFPCRFLALA